MEKLSLKSISSIVLICSFALLTILAIVILYTHRDKNTYLMVFNSLLPLIGAWVGTVLAFYFGKDNFEAASNQYKDLITQLTPELLDDVLVNQIMIDKATMVWKDYDTIINTDIKELSKFLGEIQKSRLPILIGDKVKYIIHKSTFDQAIAKNPNPENPILFSSFTENNKMIEKFETVFSNTKLEAVLKILNAKADVQDVFVSENEKVIGWLPDSLIKRYLLKN